MVFKILASPMWRVLLLPFGGTPDRSYLELEDGRLHARFGWLFDERFDLRDIEGASPSHWPLWAGIGWRTNFRGTVGLIGTYVNIVEIRFKERQRVRMLLPSTCERLYVSVEEPGEFVSALHAAIREAGGTKPKAKEAVTAGNRASSGAPKRRRKKSG